MATGHERKVGGLLDGLLSGGTAAGLSDGQLLERFATGSGSVAELAFASIVERHGAMVLRVCEAVAGNRHDAEDAFQATFLVLVKKGRSLWVTDSLGPWLHQVALRTAHGARVAAARRRRHEDALATRAEAAGDAGEDHDDLVRIVHEEIGRLPDRYRVPVVLCDLEGQTQEQVAHHAGLPVGTVKSRLRRARERLRTRLSGRGLSPTIGAGAAVPVIPPGPDHPLPDALVRSTTAAALRATSLRTLAGTSAGLLAQGVITTMARSSWWKAGTSLLAAAAVSGAGLVSGKGNSDPVAAATQPPAVRRKARLQPKPPAEVALLPAVPGHFRVNVSGRGPVSVVNQAKVAADVDSPLAIVSLRPDGSQVKKGDLVVELDSASLRDSLTNQKISTLSAEAAYRNARLAREIAEIAAKEYEEGVYVREKATILEEIKLAGEDIASTHIRLDRAKQARQRLKEILARKDHAATAGEIVAELDLDDRLDRTERDSQREKMGLEVAQNKLKVLEQYTKPKTVKMLRIEVEKALSDENTKEDAFRLEREKEARLAAKVQKCKLLAPMDGRVNYDDDPGARLEKGLRISPGQNLFTIHEFPGPMQVAARLGEPTIDRVTEGQRVDIRIDAFPDRRFTGVVTRVPNGPDETRTEPGKHLYTTMIRIEGTDASLRPGMNAEVDILVAERPDAITVPFEAVLGRMPPFRLAVKQPDGRIEIREVALGYSDESRVEVKSGLRPGEQVVLQPRSLLGETEAGQAGR